MFDDPSLRQMGLFLNNTHKFVGFTACASARGIACLAWRRRFFDEAHQLVEVGAGPSGTAQITHFIEQLCSACCRKDIEKCLTGLSLT